MCVCGRKGGVGVYMGANTQGGDMTSEEGIHFSPLFLSSYVNRSGVRGGIEGLGDPEESIFFLLEFLELHIR